MIKSVDEARQILCSPSASVEAKYDALFHLRSIPTEEACKALMDSYPHLGTSEFLKHDVMYVLGQNKHACSVDFLIKAMHDEAEAPVVRHEAGEALGNFNEYRDRLIPELKKHWDSEVEVLKSTVRIATRKLEQFSDAKNNFNKFMKGTIEPAEPFSQEELDAYLKSVGKSYADIPVILVDPSVEEYTRYQIMYFLRDKGDEASVLTVARLLKKEHWKEVSPLMRHEVCFIMGQFDEKAKLDEVKQILKECITDLDEAAIARHEAILAYSQIWGNDELILSQKEDKNDLIKESAYVVLSEK